MLIINDYSVIFSFVFTWKKYVNIKMDGGGRGNFRKQSNGFDT
jgi:hypothetical protein